MQEPAVYLNGQFVLWSQACVPIYDSGVVSGATITEMVRTFGHRLYRLGDHLARLGRGLEVLGIEAGLSLDEWVAAADDVVRRNAAEIGPERELGLVIFVTAGPHEMYAGGRNQESGLRNQGSGEVESRESRVERGSPKEVNRAELSRPDLQGGPTVCMHTFELPLERYARQAGQGVHVVIPQVRHVPPECLPAGAKHRSRLGSVSMEATSD